MNEDSDKYCLIPRSVPKKWIVVELSEEILMKSIAIANYEYYSCSFKHFKVYASVKYPCKEKSNCWELLGTFQAANSRKVQHFTFKKPSITRYVKLEFLSHYGENEYYCTLSLLRVHGSTLLEDLKKSLQKSSKKNSESTQITNEQTQSNNHGSIEYDIKKEEANLNELIKENTEQIASIHNSDKENSKRLDQLEESFGKLLNDDISNLIKEKITNSRVNSKTEFWAMLVKKKFQSFGFCNIERLNDGNDRISFIIEQEKDVINCTCFKVFKKDFIERVGFLKNSDKGFSLYNRTLHSNNTMNSQDMNTISNKNREIWGVCQYRVTYFSLKCINNGTLKFENIQPTKKPTAKDSKKKQKVVVDDETDGLDEKTPMKSTLSHLLNEKQNILKSLFNASKYFMIELVVE